MVSTGITYFDHGYAGPLDALDWLQVSGYELLDDVSTLVSDTTDDYAANDRETISAIHLAVEPVTTAAPVFETPNFASSDYASEVAAIDEDIVRPVSTEIDCAVPAVTPTVTFGVTGATTAVVASTDSATPATNNTGYSSTEIDSCKVIEITHTDSCCEVPCDDLLLVLDDVLSTSLGATIESEKTKKPNESTNAVMPDPPSCSLSCSENAGFSGDKPAGLSITVVQTIQVVEKNADYVSASISLNLEKIVKSPTPGVGIDTCNSVDTRPSTESSVGSFQIAIPQLPNGFDLFFEDVKRQWSEVIPIYGFRPIVKTKDFEQVTPSYTEELQLERDEVHGPMILIVHNSGEQDKCVIDGSACIVVCHHQRSCRLQGPKSLVEIATKMECKPLADFAYFVSKAYSHVGFRFMECSTQFDLLMRCKQNGLLMEVLLQFCIQWLAGLKIIQTALLKEMQLLEHLNSQTLKDWKLVEKNYFDFYEEASICAGADAKLKAFLIDRELLAKEALRLVDLKELAMHYVYIETMAMLLDIKEEIPNDWCVNLDLGQLESEIEYRFECLDADGVNVEIQQASTMFMRAHGISKFSLLQKHLVQVYRHDLKADLLE